MTENTTTADLYIAMPDGTFDHVIHNPKIKIEVVEQMPDGAWYAMGMFRTLEDRETAHRLAERHIQLTGHETRVVTVLSAEEYRAELERRGAEYAKQTAAAEASAPAAPTKAKNVELYAKLPDGGYAKRTTGNPYTAALAVQTKDGDWFAASFSRNSASATKAQAGWRRTGHATRIVPVISHEAMLAEVAATMPAEPTAAEAQESAARDAAATAVALRASKNATVAVVPGPTPPAEAEDGRRIELRQTSATAAAGTVLDSRGHQIAAITAVRQGRTWTVGTPDAAASGSTLAVAVKRWARGYGIARGSAAITNDRTGRTATAAWDGWRNR